MGEKKAKKKNRLPIEIDQTVQGWMMGFEPTAFRATI